MSTDPRQRNAQSAQATMHARRDARSGERTQRRIQREDQFSMCAPWSHLTQVSNDRLAHRSDEGKLLGTTLLGAIDANCLSLPVNILELQPSDLSAAQTTNDQEQYDRQIADLRRRIARRV